MAGGLTPGAKRALIHISRREKWAPAGRWIPPRVTVSCRRRRQLATIAPEHLRPIDRPHRLVMQAREKAHALPLDGRAAGLVRDVADRGRQGDQQGDAGDPVHLQEGVDRPVERRGDREQALRRLARNDLPDRPQRRRMGPDERRVAPPRQAARRPARARRPASGRRTSAPARPRESRGAPRTAPGRSRRRPRTRRHGRARHRRSAATRRGGSGRRRFPTASARTDSAAHSGRARKPRFAPPATEAGRRPRAGSRSRWAARASSASTLLPPPDRALEVDDESLCRAQRWPIPQRPDNAPGERARSGVLPRWPAKSHPDPAIRPVIPRPGRPAPPPDMSANPPKAALLPISATVICKNEEACIGKCLAKPRGRRRDRRRRFRLDRPHARHRRRNSSRAGLPIRLIRQDWLGYARQKQFALDKAREPWVLSIDADEWLDDALASDLPRLIAADEAIAGWRLRRTLTLYGSLKPVSLWTRPEHILRLVRRARARFDERSSSMRACSSRAGRRSPKRACCATSAACRSTRRCARRSSTRGSRPSSGSSRAAKPSWAKLFFNPPIYFLRIFFWNRFFLCGWAGFIHAMTGATYSFMTEAMHRQFTIARKRP